jgi:hypothetical protein
MEIAEIEQVVELVLGSEKDEAQQKELLRTIQSVFV